jgi:hypothetical protein
VCDEISYLTQCERWQEAINRVGEHFTDAFEQPGRHPEFTRRLSLLANNDIPPKSATFCLDFLLPTDANIYTGAICSALAKNSSLTKVTFLMFPRQMRSEESSALMHVILTKTRISSATFRDFDISREVRGFPPSSFFHVLTLLFFGARHYMQFVMQLWRASRS